VALLAELAVRGGLDFAQVRITPGDRGWELRHVDDIGKLVEQLQKLSPAELRPLAQSTTAGAFRPIKTAPNLRSGWWCWIPEAEAATLALALDDLYPGALTDWWVLSRPGSAPVQSYRELTARQTGMYRVTQQLTDAEAAEVIATGCDAQFCLKKRLWTVPGLAPDEANSGKSIIPCLEMCPLMLEFARCGRRLVQQQELSLRLAAGELATLLTALEGALAGSVPNVREGDLGSPTNPRRIRLLMHRLQGLVAKGKITANED